MRRHRPELDAATIADGDAHFTGTLTLEPGTEPYTVHATMFARDAGAPLRMRLTGDTGGEYRAFRRTFPFESALARTGDAVCHAPATVSSLPPSPRERGEGRSEGQPRTPT